MAPFIRALTTEMQLYADHYPETRFGTLYLGGGTPSVLDRDQLTAVLRAADTCYEWIPAPERSIEVNPGTVTRSWLETCLDLGINRLSIGAQSFRPGELVMLNRIHSAEDTVHTVKLARETGFRNLGLDLIYGLPGQVWADWRISLERAVGLEPEHISAYILTWSGETDLGKHILDGGLPEPEEDHTAGLFLKTHEFLVKAGYSHYEVSNYALPGRECMHNMQYWDGTPYLGLGPSAHSFSGKKRWWNVRDLPAYNAMLGENRVPVEGLENLTDEAVRMERIALGLRTNRGIMTALIRNKSCADDLIENGMADIDGGRLILTARGLLLADEIAVRLTA